MSTSPPYWRTAYLALVLAGGALGTACRILAGQLIHPGAWPWATLTVNLIGAFVLGWLTEATLRRDSPRGARLRALAGTGFCGGLTTYSTLAVDVAQGLAAQPARMLVYLAASVVLGIAAAWVGVAAGRSRRTGEAA